MAVFPPGLAWETPSEEAHTSSVNEGEMVLFVPHGHARSAGFVAAGLLVLVCGQTRHKRTERTGDAAQLTSRCPR
eukprot:12224797-Heterocapsa_arctica.AAC.1